MPDQTNMIIEWVSAYVWIPFVAFIMGTVRKAQQENKERDSEIAALKERAAVVEATRMTREEVTEVLESKFEKLEDKFEKIEDKIDKVSTVMNDVLRSLPKRSGDV